MVQENLVVPGEVLGVSEEFVNGFGTLEDAEGKIYAIFEGKIEKNSSKRSISIDASKIVRPLQSGDLVYGRIEDLYSSMALVTFQPVVNGNIYPSGGGSAFIRISELDDSYVQSLSDHIRIGDMIKAKIAEIKPLATYLTIKESTLGVISAYCSKDRFQMNLINNRFVCPNCSNSERRKIIGNSNKNQNQRPQFNSRSADFNSSRQNRHRL